MHGALGSHRIALAPRWRCYVYAVMYVSIAPNLLTQPVWALHVGDGRGVMHVRPLVFYDGRDVLLLRYSYSRNRVLIRAAAHP